MSRKGGADWTTDRTKTHSLFYFLAYSLLLPYSNLMCGTIIFAYLGSKQRSFFLALNTTQSGCGWGKGGAIPWPLTSIRPPQRLGLPLFILARIFSLPFSTWYHGDSSFPVWGGLPCLTCPWENHIVSACLPTNKSPSSPSYPFLLALFILVSFYLFISLSHTNNALWFDLWLSKAHFCKCTNMSEIIHSDCSLLYKYF